MNYLFNKKISKQINNKINYLLEEADRVNLGRVTFDMWMANQFGPNWIENVPNSNLFLYQQFFRQYPTGKPPSNWQSTSYTQDQLGGQLDRVRIRRPTMQEYADAHGGRAKRPIGPTQGPDSSAEQLYDLEGEIVFGAAEYLENILNSRPNISDSPRLTIPWPWQSNSSSDKDSDNSNNTIP